MVILRPVGTTGNRLKYLRKIRGLTRKEAAVKLDMKEERLQDLETGRKAEHEKKPVETEMAWYIQIVDASNHLLVHEERISIDCNTTADEKKKEILQKWCSEHQGEFYAVSERRCVVRSENT